MPVNRNTSLIPLSREHHFALQLCWKIKQGIKLEVEVDRINKYIQWFYNHYLLHHFYEEESYLFPLLGNDNIHIQQALDEHLALEQKIQFCDLNYATLIEFAVLLDNHIRFEERIIFNEIQQLANIIELEKLEVKLTQTKFVENSEDEFWNSK